LPTPKYIYESPDGGKTVYRRLFDAKQRHLMSSGVEVITQFDITPTGVKSYRRSSELSDADWNYQRNQQRNFETIMQCISLRCQPMNITPVTTFYIEDQKVWCFQFETEVEAVFWKDNDPVGILKSDCEGVPMIVGLNETYKDGFFHPYLITEGISANISFGVV